MYPQPILEKFEHDRKLALASGEERACGKKIRYATMVHATKAAYNLEVKSPGETLEPYHCPWCGCYHVGHAVELGNRLFHNLIRFIIYFTDKFFV